MRVRAGGIGETRLFLLVIRDGSSVSAELVLMLREMAAGCLDEEESLPLYMMLERSNGAERPCYYSEFMSLF